MADESGSGALYLWLHSFVTDSVLWRPGILYSSLSDSGRGSDRRCYGSRPVLTGLQYGCGKARLDYSALPRVLPAKQHFFGEPTSGLEPLTCSLRVSCS